MKIRLSLGTRISAILSGVVLLAMISGGVAVVSAHRFQDHLRTIVDENLVSVRAAEELEIALLEQRGYVSSFMLDKGNTEWLAPLNEKRAEFDFWLERARASARSAEEREILDQLEIVQGRYEQKRDEAVELYQAGQIQEAQQVLLHDVVALYLESYNLCEAFIDVNQKLVDEASHEVRRHVGQVAMFVTIVAVVTVVLIAGLLWSFFYSFIFPLRRMARDARAAAGDNGSANGGMPGDEMREVGHYFQLLMADVAETRSDLARSQSQLAHADKLAAVGKLAASVAHEIRNPLTAMKMWLFSLKRSVEGNSELLDKVNVVTEETVRLENIVHQFLEFSRPPRLELSRQAMAQLVEKTLELVAYRLDERNIQVAELSLAEDLAVQADAQQLRQVLLNLLNNAIDALPGGGEIRLSAHRTVRGGKEWIQVRIADNGTGISEEVQQRIFEPFYTTKSEGTGLGLCIAASVMARHGGTLSLETTSAKGTTWLMTIPAS